MSGRMCCPFCGPPTPTPRAKRTRPTRRQVSAPVGADGFAWVMECPTCGARGPLAACSEEARQEWNRRGVAREPRDIADEHENVRQALSLGLED